MNFAGRLRRRNFERFLQPIFVMYPNTTKNNIVFNAAKAHVKKELNKHGNKYRNVNNNSIIRNIIWTSGKYRKFWENDTPRRSRMHTSPSPARRRNHSKSPHRPSRQN